MNRECKANFRWFQAKGGVAAIVTEWLGGDANGSWQYVPQGVADVLTG